MVLLKRITPVSTTLPDTQGARKKGAGHRFNTNTAPMKKKIAISFPGALRNI
jgi:hypothetical protein